MLRATTLIALLSAFAYAQDRVVPLFLLDADPQALVASVITAEPSETQYLISCPTGGDLNECGYNPAQTVRHAGSVFGGHVTAASLQFTYSWECTVTPTSGAFAVCTSSVGGEQANSPGVGTALVAGDLAPFRSVTVTAGADQLAAPTADATAIIKAATSSQSGVASATVNSAPTAGVGLGLAGLAAAALIL